MSVRKLNTIKTDFEQVMDAFQGLEQVASKSHGHASDVASAMVPIIFQMELVQARINDLYDQLKPVTASRKSNVISVEFGRDCDS